MKIEVNDTNLEYKEVGNGSTILLVHGSSSDYRTWKNQIDVFGKKFHTNAYSRRFHYPNENISSGQDYSMEQQLDDLEEVIQKLDTGAVHIVGHSYGGFLGLLLAIKRPTLIKSLVLVEPPVFTLFISIPPGPLEIIKLLLTKPRTAFTIINFARKGINPATKAAENDNMDKALEVFSKAVLGEEAFNNLSGDRLEQARRNTFKAEFLGSGFLAIEGNDIAKVEIPTLLINGEMSPPLFHRFNDRLEELLPNSKRIIISNSSHIVQEDNAEDFNENVLNFIQLHE